METERTSFSGVSCPGGMLYFRGRIRMLTISPKLWVKTLQNKALLMVITAAQPDNSIKPSVMTEE